MANSYLVPGTEGIGSGIAMRLAQAGADVCIVGRNQQRGDQIVLKMKDAHPQDHGNQDPTKYRFVQADLR